MGTTSPSRLRFFGDEELQGIAVFAYSSETDKLSVVLNGEFCGPPEHAFRVFAELYLGHA